MVCCGRDWSFGGGVVIQTEGSTSTQYRQLRRLYSSGLSCKYHTCVVDVRWRNYQFKYIDELSRSGRGLRERNFGGRDDKDIATDSYDDDDVATNDGDDDDDDDDDLTFKDLSVNK